MRKYNKLVEKIIKQVLNEEANASNIEIGGPDAKFPYKLSDVNPEKAKANSLSGLQDRHRSDDKIDISQISVAVKELKPSQSSMQVTKALGFAVSMILKSGPFKGGPGGNLGAFISEDGYIMDGHHRWISSFMVDPNSQVGGYIVGLPRKQLISVLNTLTKGAYGVESGKPASGGFDQFQPEPLYKALLEFAQNGNEFTKAENVVKACIKFTGVENPKQAIKAAAQKFSKNLESATMSVPSDGLDRKEMPVIDGDAVKDAASKLAAGAVDVNPPYVDQVHDPDKQLPDRYQLKESTKNRFKKLAGLF